VEAGGEEEQGDRGGFHGGSWAMEPDGTRSRHGHAASFHGVLPRRRARSRHTMSGSLSRRFRVGVRLPEWSTGFSFRIFAGLTDFQRQKEAFQLVFDQPSGGDLPPAPVDASWDGDGLIVFRHTAEEGEAWRKRGIAVVNLSTETPA